MASFSPISGKKSVTARSQHPQSPKGKFSGRSSPTKKKSFDHDEIKHIEEIYPDIADKDIQTLRAMKKNAINEYDFQKSNSIALYIQLISQDNTSKIIEQFQLWLKERILDCLNKYERNIQEIEIDIDKKKKLINDELLLVFSRIEQRQNNEKKEVDKNHALEADRESTRCSSDVRNLMVASKNLAIADDIEGAKSFHNTAVVVQTSQIEERLQAIDNKYKNMLSQMLQKHKQEFELFQEKAEKNYEIIENMRKEDLLKQQKKIEVYIRYILKKAIQEGSKQLVRAEMRTKVSNELTLFAKDFLAHENQRFLLEVLE